MLKVIFVKEFSNFPNRFVSENKTFTNLCQMKRNSILVNVFIWYMRHTFLVLEMRINNFKFSKDFKITDKRNILFLKWFLTISATAYNSVWYYITRNLLQIPVKPTERMLAGVVLAQGTHWKFLRSTISPTFTVGKLKLVSYITIKQQ